MATRDYTLGKGKVLFQPENEDGYIDLGNAPAFTINLAVEKLEHFSSREGLSTKDMEVITKLGMGGSFTLDEPNANNLAMFVMSAAGAEADAQNSGTTPADAITDIVLDRWYPLSLSSGGSVANGAVTAAADNQGSGTTSTLSGVQSASASKDYVIRVKAAGASGAATVVCKEVGGAFSTTPIAITDNTNFDVKIGADVDTGLNYKFLLITTGTLKEGDEFTFSTTYTAAATTRLSNVLTATHATFTQAAGDFVLDLAAGLIMFLSTGTVPPASTFTFATTTYSANAGRRVTAGGTLTSLKGNLYFVGNPPVGRVLDVQGYCSITPNGDFSLIGADWMTAGFSVEFLKASDTADLVTLTDRGKI